MPQRNLDRPGRHCVAGCQEIGQGSWTKGHVFCSFFQFMLSFPFSENSYLSKNSELASGRYLTSELSESKGEVIKMGKDLF